MPGGKRREAKRCIVLGASGRLSVRCLTLSSGLDLGVVGVGPALGSTLGGRPRSYPSARPCSRPNLCYRIL